MHFPLEKLAYYYLLLLVLYGYLETCLIFQALLNKTIFKNKKVNNYHDWGTFEDWIEYKNNLIQSEKLLLNFEENIVTISDNIIYEGIKGLVKADNIKIDLISKNIEIFMNNSKNKVKIISKN